MEEINPGPINGRVLYLQRQHRSEDVWAGRNLDPLTCRSRQAYAMTRWVPHERMEPYIRRAGFYHVHRLGERFQVDWPLITALVERWRQETHTFHLTVGEVTVTLQDVGILTGLRVDGLPVTGVTHRDWRGLCQDLLGVQPPVNAIRGSSLKISWLREQFAVLPEDATEDVVQKHVRAYIIYLIGGQLLPDKSSSLVQLLYLPLLRDFDYSRSLSWGGAVLAYLYRGLCRACKRNVKEICGPLCLLQLWAWERLHVGRPMRVEIAEMDPDTTPLGHRWRVKLSSQENPRPHTLRYYRDELDRQSDNQVVWQPYTPEVIAQLPTICLEGQNVWLAKVPLICFDIIEWHFPSRVLRQFGLLQTVPSSDDSERALHDEDRRGRPSMNWANYHRRYVNLWANRLDHIVTGVPSTVPLPRDGEYFAWYRRITRRLISPPSDQPPMVFHPSGGRRLAMFEGVVKVCENARAATARRTAAGKQLWIDRIALVGEELKELILQVRLTDEQDEIEQLLDGDDQQMMDDHDAYASVDGQQAVATGGLQGGGEQQQRPMEVEQPAPAPAVEPERSTARAYNRPRGPPRRNSNNTAIEQERSGGGDGASSAVRASSSGDGAGSSRAPQKRTRKAARGGRTNGLCGFGQTFKASSNS